MSARISVAVNTLNEEARLPYALRSVRSWADELVVVDMHSDDRTAEVARAHGARVLLHERVHYVEPARAFAVAQCTGDWILILDADELVPEPLSRALRALAERGDVGAARIPRINYMFGGPIEHGMWGPAYDRHVRFFRRGALDPPAQIHGTLAARPGVHVVDLDGRDEALVHFNYLDIAQFVEKLNRYTTIEAQGERASGRRPGGLGLWFAATRDLLGRHVKRGGFRNGWRGDALAMLMFFYRLVAAAKVRELEESGTRDEVIERYRRVAEDVLARYEPPTASR